MSVTAAGGFLASGFASGIKPNGALDTALVATADGQPVTTVAVFTSNLVAAAPVQLSRQRLQTHQQAAAVLLNSGNANAATGSAGLATAQACTDAIGDALGVDPSTVLVCSTGLIGIPMAADPIVGSAPAVVAALEATADSGTQAAKAIMTTDTVPKEAVATVSLKGTDGLVGTVGGMAKGAAMLEPAMATMLAVITTDIAIDAARAQLALQHAVDQSFNSLSVDGCRSTNDTVILMCNGAVGNEPIASSSEEAFTHFEQALVEVCTSLARQMADDAEGATKTITIEVHGARTDHEAKLAARQVANSNLVKCSFYGNDPYWGRVLSELGVSGAVFDPDDVTISYGGVVNCRSGIAAPHDEAQLESIMQQRSITLRSDLGAGSGTARMWFTDLTHAYIDENMGTS